MRSLWIFLAALAAAPGSLRAGVVIDKDAPQKPAHYYAQPSVPSIVFLSPEARDSNMAPLASETPFVPLAPVLIPIQPRAAFPFLSAPGPFNRSILNPPAGFMAGASLAAARAFRSGNAGGSCPQDPLWSFRAGFGTVYPFGNACWLSPYVPLVIAPEGFNQPADRLPNTTNAARQLERARNFRLDR